MDTRQIEDEVGNPMILPEQYLKLQATTNKVNLSVRELIQLGLLVYLK